MGSLVRFFATLAMPPGRGLAPEDVIAPINPYDIKHFL